MIDIVQEYNQIEDEEEGGQHGQMIRHYQKAMITVLQIQYSMNGKSFDGYFNWRLI